MIYDTVISDQWRQCPNMAQQWKIPVISGARGGSNWIKILSREYLGSQGRFTTTRELILLPRWTPPRWTAARKANPQDLSWDSWRWSHGDPQQILWTLGDHPVGDCQRGGAIPYPSPITVGNYDDGWWSQHIHGVNDGAMASFITVDDG